jgi:hypothetical protein
MRWIERIYSKIRGREADHSLDLHDLYNKIRMRLPVLQPAYLTGRSFVEAAGGQDLLVGLAREIRERDETNTAYVLELSPQKTPDYYQIDLRWDLRQTEEGRYAFSYHESKRVSVYGRYRVWGAGGFLDVYYYLPREGDPNRGNPVNVDAELRSIVQCLPKPLAEYTLEDKVRYAMARTSHRIDFLYGVEVARMDKRAEDILSRG